MTYLTRGPGRMLGIGSKGQASGEQTPFCPLIVSATGGEGKSHLTRGPGLLGIGSKGHVSKESTPFRSLTANALGGDSMSPFIVSASRTHRMQFLMKPHAHGRISDSRFQTTPQATS